MRGDVIPNSSVRMVQSKPTDEWLDTFNFGSEPWAREVQEEFESRIWTERLDLFVFLDDASDGALVGGGRFRFGNLPDPDDAHKRHYFLVMAIGVQVEYQRRVDLNSDPPRTYAREIMDFVETKARAKDRCVGMSLWVRVENEWAQKFYRELEFEVVRGPFEWGENAYFEMRKSF